jgi:hypothetical protein
LEYGNGGVQCTLCEKFALTGGLHFHAIQEAPLPKPRSNRRRLFTAKRRSRNPGKNRQSRSGIVRATARDLEKQKRNMATS